MRDKLQILKLFLRFICILIAGITLVFVLVLLIKVLKT